METKGVVGKAFTLSTPQAIEFTQEASLLSQVTEKPLYRYQAVARWGFDLDHTKATDARDNKSTRIGISWDMLSAPHAHPTSRRR